MYVGAAVEPRGSPIGVATGGQRNGCRPSTTLALRHVTLPSRSVVCQAVTGRFEGRSYSVMGSQATSVNPSVLVADIGGTNCRFQLWSVVGKTADTMLLEQIYPTEDYERFDQALSAFLSTPEGLASPPSAAAFACAGPVKDDCCRFTNISWVVDKAEVERDFEIPCRVLNDFEAIGYGVTQLSDDQILKVHDVTRDPRGPIAVLGPGTGLGEAQLFWDDGINSYRVQPSEGSHATFRAHEAGKQRALQSMVEAERGHCSVERVACGSGPGAYLRFFGDGTTSGATGQASCTWRTPRLRACPRRRWTGPIPWPWRRWIFLISIVGAEAGHMALRSLASGGVYIAGGILPKVINRATEGGLFGCVFLWRESRFHDKVLKFIPLYVVLDEKVGLLGSRFPSLAHLAERALARVEAVHATLHMSAISCRQSLQLSFQFGVNPSVRLGHVPIHSKVPGRRWDPHADAVNILRCNHLAS